MNDQAISSLGESGDQSEEFLGFRLFPIPFRKLNFKNEVIESVMRKPLVWANFAVLLNHEIA